LSEAPTDSFMETLNFSSDVDFLFEKAAENAIIRFKTPVVTPDILLITMMEEKSISSAKIIKKLIPKEMDWYLLRFTLLKSLHRKESILRTDVQINQRYFAYLLNIEYSDKDLEKIFENKLLTENILLFRNKLIKTTLNKNIFDVLAKDIHNSIEFNQSRVYKHV
jgi:hypothetical protein